MVLVTKLRYRCYYYPNLHIKKVKSREVKCYPSWFWTSYLQFHILIFAYLFSFWLSLFCFLTASFEAQPFPGHWVETWLLLVPTRPSAQTLLNVIHITERAAFAKEEERLWPPCVKGYWGPCWVFPFTQFLVLLPRTY